MRTKAADMLLFLTVLSEKVQPARNPMRHLQLDQAHSENREEFKQKMDLKVNSDAKNAPLGR
jgi:hypothetical protein